MLRLSGLLYACLSLILGACSLEQDIETNDQENSIVVECQPEDCGPELAITCAEGTVLVSDPVCESNVEGTCAWSSGECSDLAPIDETSPDEISTDGSSPDCQPEDCGPEIAISCDMGYSLTHEAICEANTEGMCEWNTGECVEDESADECQPNDCGPEIAISCEMGYSLTHEPICEANEEGFCEWNIGECIEEM
jgi:hypothetical protein